MGGGGGSRHTLTQQFIRIDKPHNNYRRRLECRQSPGHKANKIIARQILLGGIRRSTASTTLGGTTGQRNVALGVWTITAYVAMPAQ